MAITINNLENSTNRTNQLHNNLVCELFYDLNWVNRNYAVEWWQNNGHFNDELYARVIQAKVNNEKKNNVVF